MPMPILDSVESFNLTATGDVGKVGQDKSLVGFYVNSTTAGTIAFKKGGTGGTSLGGTITPAIGFHRFPAIAPGGLFATIGGTLDVTIFVNTSQA